MLARAPAARPRDPRPTRDQILDAAERAFAERGFSGVSMREIAAEAGLRNQASLYHHFRDKHALYEAVLARGVEAIVALVAAGEPAGPPGVGEMIDRLLDYLAEHPHLPRLIERAGLDDSHAVGRTATRLLRPLYAQGIAVLAASRGPWKPEELPFVGAGLYHLIFGYFANASLFEAVVGADPHGSEAVARQRRFVKAALRRLLGVPVARRPLRTARREGQP
jgi:AcrR family transcriptional regulator